MRWGAGLEGDERGPNYTRLGEVEAFGSRAGAHLDSLCARGLELDQERRSEEIA